MSATSTIEWTDATWNPVTGCTKVSPGCAHCYAETFAERWRGVPGHHFEKGFDLVLRPDKLDLPLHWTKPRRIFVTSMGDLFHKDVPEEFIRAVFGVMAQARQHTFQLLTKRPERMREVLTRWQKHGLTLREGCGVVLPNVWLGTSVENQATAIERIPLLIKTPAAIRFLSCEPLLGPVSLVNLHKPSNWRASLSSNTRLEAYKHIDWMIVGGESGPGARPMQPDWARGLRSECQETGTPFFFKQWGAWAPEIVKIHLNGKPIGSGTVSYSGNGHSMMYKLGKSKSGRVLDGRTWDEFPKAAL